MRKIISGSLICLFLLNLLVEGHIYVKDNLPDTKKPKRFLSPCPNAMCNGLNDGNYATLNETNSLVSSTSIRLKKYHDYYLKCYRSRAYCFPCSKNTFFSEDCNQCLMLDKLHLSNPCYDTSLTPRECPSNGSPYAMTECASAGENFTGNLVDFRGNLFRYPTKVFLACWNGAYVGCSECANGLFFKELINYFGSYYNYGHCGKRKSMK